jgi:hypothetical protein
MAFVPAPNIVQVEWRATRNGSQIENRLMIDVLTAPTEVLLTALATAMWDWWVETYTIVLHGDVHLTEVVATDMGASDGFQVTYAPDAVSTGSRTGAALPNEVAVCVSLRTSSRGRSARGRFYTLSVSLNQMVDDNNLSSAAAAEILSVMDSLLTIIGDFGYLPSIVSYVHDNAPRVGGPVYYPITSAILVDTLVDSQKRRKPGVGS